MAAALPSVSTFLDGLGLEKARIIGNSMGGVVATRFAIANPDRVERLVTIGRSEEHTSELQSLMRISYAVFCLKKKNIHNNLTHLSYIPSTTRRLPCYMYTL